MKKRSISLLCAIAIVITMLSVGTVLALTPIVDTSDILTFDSNGGNSSDGLVGTGVAFNSNTPIVENDWTASGTVKLASDKTYIELATGDSDKLQTYTYNILSHVVHKVHFCFRQKTVGRIRRIPEAIIT